MDKRLETLFNLAGSGDVFLDIGCDHGFVSEYALKSGKFNRVIITDISAKSLGKAINLLKPYGDRVKSAVTDGFNGVSDDVSVAFIAGMGGEEIVKILRAAKQLPPKLVLSPQKNVDKVRKTLIELGYKIERDFTFKSGRKFYDGILAVKGKDFYNELELKYGRENLINKNVDFIDKLKSETAFKKSLLTKVVNKSERDEIQIKINELEGIINETR